VAVAQYHIRKKIDTLVGEKNAQRFYDAWLSSHCTKQDIDSLASWGFNSVRLPMHYNLYTLPVEKEKGTNNTWLNTGFALTDSVLKWCKANRIYLILDLHAAPGGQGNDIPISDRDTSKPSLWDSEANQQKTIALWKKLAERYANEEWIGAYDILNEPNWGFQNKADRNGCNENENAPLKDLYKKITAAIRSVDQKHMIIIEGNCWGNNYNGLFPLWDKNLALSFHKYWNYNNQEAMQKYLGYRDTYNVPIWLGETGENSNAWFTDMILLMEKNRIGWNMWPLKKSGNNNPLEVTMNKGFLDIIDYWKGKSPKPKEEIAFNSLMEFARNTQCSRNIVQRGVIDAVTRQTKNDETIPFGSNNITNGTIIYAADYDYGRIGIAYQDSDSADYWVSTSSGTKWNEGEQYRNDAVDIKKCNDHPTNGYCVGWIKDGEWLQYSVYASKDAQFDLNVRYRAVSTAAFTCIVNNKQAGVSQQLTPAIDDSWQVSSLKSISLHKGWNAIKILAVKGGFELNYLQFNPSAEKTLSTN
jgi:hypothetical protein